MFKKIFLSTIKFEVHKKDFGVTSLVCPPYLWAWAEPSPESLPFGSLHVCAGGLDILEIYI